MPESSGFCEQCGGPLGEGVAFCESCGAAVPGDQPAPAASVPEPVDTTPVSAVPAAAVTTPAPVAAAGRATPRWTPWVLIVVGVVIAVASIVSAL